MALAVNTPTHLQGLGLLPNTSRIGKDTEKENVAYLFHVALEKVKLIYFFEYFCNENVGCAIIICLLLIPFNKGGLNDKYNVQNALNFFALSTDLSEIGAR